MRTPALAQARRASLHLRQLAVALLAVLCLGLTPAAAVDGPETISKEDARQQAEKARVILREMGFTVGAPEWMARYGVTIGDVWHNHPQWWVYTDDTLNTPEGKVGWSVVTAVFLSPAAAKTDFDEYLKRDNEKEQKLQQFMTTSAGAGYAGMTFKPEARILCGNVQLKVGWRRGLPLGKAEDEAYISEGVAAVKAMARRVHEDFAARGVYGAQAEEKRPADPPINSGAIDKYLDLLGAKLKAARDLASAPSLDPLAPPTGPFSYQQASVMAASVWLECQGLIRAHIDRCLVLNDGQKNRLKAFGWWADWIVQRGANPFKIQWQQPPYPLLGPVNDTVPTPPQYKGADMTTFVMPYWQTTEAITDDYAWFVVSTALRIGDVYTTGGLLYTAYLACTSDSLGEVALNALTCIPYVGKWISAVLCTYIEGNAIYHMGTDGTNPLTWDQHVANLCAVANLGLQGIRTFSANSARAVPAAGVDEGAIPPEVSQKFGGKSFQLNGRQQKQLAGGEKVEVADAEYAIVGDFKGKPKDAPFVVYKNRQVAIRKSADGTERYYHLEGDTVGDPIFFLGEKGYHVWTHLTELKSGHRTPYRSVSETMADRPDYTKTLTGIEKTMRDPGGDLVKAQEAYVNFVNKLIDDGQYEKMQGWYVYTKRGATPEAPRIAVGGKEANTFVMVPRPRSDPSQIARYSVRISIDPATGKLMNVFVNSPGEKSPFMSNMLAESLRRHFFSWNDHDKVVFTCPELKVLMGEQQQ